MPSPTRVNFHLATLRRIVALFRCVRSTGTRSDLMFTKPWIPVTSDEQATRVPMLDVFFRTGDGRFVRQTLIVDSGADVSMGPRALCKFLGLS